MSEIDRLLRDVDLDLNGEFTRSRLQGFITTVPFATPEFEQAFPGRFVRDPAGRLLSIDARPVNLDGRERDEVDLAGQKVTARKNQTARHHAVVRVGRQKQPQRLPPRTGIVQPRQKSQRRPKLIPKRHVAIGQKRHPRDKHGRQHRRGHRARQPVRQPGRHGGSGVRHNGVGVRQTP